MGKTLLFLMLLFTNIAFAQVNEDFSDGNFTTNPVWSGSTTAFTINAAGQLQSNGPQVSSTIYLSTPNTLATKIVWEFSVNLAFDPSTTNYPRVYLMSNQQNLSVTTGLQGYYLQLGATGSADNFTLVKQNGAVSTTILTLPDKTRSSANMVNVHVKVERDENGNWDVYTDFAGGTNYTLDGSVTDNTYTTTGYFGVYCRYATASRYNLFNFDDFKIATIIPDVTPPTVSSVKSIDGKTLEVTFNEAVKIPTAQSATNYSISGGVGTPTTAAMGANSTIVNLIFANEFASGNYALTVSNVQDNKGNAIATPVQKNFLHINPYTAKVGDVVINEIFADPTPQIGLPTGEFTELWNTTNEYILLSGWKYADQTTTYTFGTDTIMPNSYLILCANGDAPTYKPLGKTIALSSWPSLNNDKDILKLTSPAALVIDQVAYADTWYKDDVKNGGGYSLELIDPKNKCTGIQNWTASTAAIGGSPGTSNSVYQSQYSNVAPKLMSATVVDETTVHLEFSKFVDSLTASIPSNYSINNGIGLAVSALPVGPAFTSVDIKISNPISRGIENLITINGLSDCAGNVIDPSANTAKLFLAKSIIAGNILISEVLFDPKGTNPDYVEVYNNTSDVFDLKELQLANTDASGNPANIKTVSTSSVFIQPKTYWVLTTSPDLVKNGYYAKYPNQFVQLASMPSYNNDASTVVLLNGTNEIDKFTYNTKMNSPLVKNPDGVALERISFAKSANEPGNFTSAAQSVGFGTPTYTNSQSEDAASAKNIVNLGSKTFSPDGDGFEDVLDIEYQLKEVGNFGTIKIYTDKGLLIRKLQQNTSLATSGKFIWDGLNDNGEVCKVGIYVIKFEVFSLKGNSDSFTKTCVLAAKL